MMVEDSGVLDAILNLAAQEAAQAGYPETTTAHVLIALSRIAEEEAPAEGSEAVVDLRREFEQLGIRPRPFRRRLRVLLGKKERLSREGRMHPSARCKAVFAEARRAAQAEGVPTDAVHLLRGALSFLGVLEIQADDNRSRRRDDAPGDEIPNEL